MILDDNPVIPESSDDSDSEEENSPAGNVPLAFKQ